MSVTDSILGLFRFNKKNWKAIVLCFFAAMVFWFFNALNKNYSANITFPLVFDYDTEKYLPAKPLPTHIRLNVNGLGWDLFRKSAGLKVPPLVIPLDKPVETRKIVASTLPAVFSTQLSGLQVNFVLTDTLFIDIDQRSSRTLPLTIEHPGAHIRENFIARNITLDPSTVMLEGPRTAIENLPDTLALRLSRKNIDENFSDDVEVILPEGEFIKRNPPVVRVTFSVEPSIEIQKSVPVEWSSPSTRYRVSVAEKSVQVLYRIPASEEQHSSDSELKASINLNRLTKGVSSAVPMIEGLPPYAELIRVDSVHITVSQ